MSFSSDTKKELCKNPYDKLTDLQAECYGLLLFAKTFKENEILLNTENSFVANRFSELLTARFQIIVEKRASLTGKRRGTHLFTTFVPDTADCKHIFTELGHRKQDISLHINRANLEDESSVSSFLRGVFLCCGSVINPAKDYHLEFTIPYKNLCGDLVKLISEVSEFTHVPKIVPRKGAYIAYLKDSEQIADLLAFMGAPISSMAIMQEKIVKEIRNDTNRRTNSEVANIKKTISAAMAQIEAIKCIQEKQGLAALPEELEVLAKLRLENPDLSLRDLGQALTPPLSRSGVNHRMKRILDYAEKL